jgi:hydrogenase maturation protease
VTRTLIAGIGNLFLGDDGFGCEVARRLALAPLPEGVEVMDAGLRGLHLAYRLLDRYDLLIAVDASVRGGAPGTLYVIEPDEATPATADAHGMNLESVLSMLRTLGGEVARVMVVGCEPAELGERMGLSPPVERAVEAAVAHIRAMVEARRSRCLE